MCLPPEWLRFSLAASSPHPMFLNEASDSCTFPKSLLHQKEEWTRGKAWHGHQKPLGATLVLHRDDGGNNKNWSLLLQELRAK